MLLNLEDGQPCPVCGSREHPQIAALSDEAPTQAEVELAKAERDKKEKIRDIKTEAFRKCLAGYQAAQEICLTLRKNIKDEAEDITGIGWKEKIKPEAYAYGNRKKIENSWKKFLKDVER